MDSLVVVLSVISTIVTVFFYLRISAEEYENTRSIDDFFLFRRRMRANRVFGTFYASGMSLATVFIAFMQLAPLFGTMLIWSIIFYALGHVVLFFLINKIRSSAGGGTTIHGFLGSKFKSSRLKRTASTVTIIGFIGVFAIELIVGATIFQTLTGSEAAYLISLIFFSLVVILYSVLGGFKSVVRTDTIQAFLIIYVCGLLVAIAFQPTITQDNTVIPVSLTQHWILPPLMMINFFLINVAFPIVDMSAWQRILAARDEMAARQGLIPAILLFLITWSAILFAALALSNSSFSDGAGGLIHALMSFGAKGPFPAILVAIGVAALVAAMLSTADTFLIASSQTIAMDLREEDAFSSPAVEPGENVRVSEDDIPIINKARFDMIIVAFVGLIMCWILREIGFDVVSMIFSVYGSTLALVPCVMFSLYTPKGIEAAHFKGAAICSIVIGIMCGWGYGILSVLSASHPGDLSFYNAPTAAFGAATIVFVVGVFVSLMMSQRKGEDKTKRTG